MKLDIETCNYENCEEVGYFIKDSKGDDYYCPLHWFIPMAEELDAEIRDRLANYLKQEQIDAVRNLVNGLFRKASDNYSLHEYIDWREKQNINKKKKEIDKKHKSK